MLASNNPQKLQELHALLASLDYQILSQNTFHVPSIEETGHTFVENALLKARHAARMTGLPALADDSGLVVPALGGAPGIYSARFAGTSSENIAKLLSALHGFPTEARRAYFYCVVVYLLSEADPTPFIAEGRWSGEILETPRGTGGFGYDACFYVRELQSTAAELPPALKNKVSHRGQAIALLIKNFKEIQLRSE